MPHTIAELYETASDAMLNRGGVCSASDLRSILQRVFFEAHVSQRREILDRQLDETALAAEKPEKLAEIRETARKKLLEQPFEPAENTRPQLGQYVFAAARRIALPPALACTATISIAPTRVGHFRRKPWQLRAHQVWLS